MTLGKVQKKYGIVSDELSELAEKIDRLNKDLLKPTVEKCLEAAPTVINPKLEEAMAKHKRTGKTTDNIIKAPKVVWDGTVAYIPVGFEIVGESGTHLASIFLMYGTARHTPANQYGKYPNKANKGVKADKKLYDAIFGSATKKEIAERQSEILHAAVEEAVNGK